MSRATPPAASAASAASVSSASSVSTVSMSPVTSIGRKLAGRPSDWQLRRPTVRAPKPALGWVGPLGVLGSVVVSWFAFANATGNGGNVAFGLFIGAVAILLMAWSFILALRPRILEPLFGGVDSMYRVHRWAGTFSIIAMFLHTSIEPEIEGGIRGASRSLADTAEDLAGTGQTMLYVLVGISLLRWFPYRYWRWTHKLLGIPFAFACFHFFTAEKTYANGSPWGWYFGAFMVAGLLAYVARVVGRDMVAPGISYRVARADLHGSSLDLQLEPSRKPLEHEAGQFVVLKLQVPGLKEPHIFTIASPPEADRLRFFIRDLGDWTAKVHAAVAAGGLVGAEVIVEGPYGQFEPFGAHHQNVVWVAGGVGITPFLSAAETLKGRDPAMRPTLHYLVRSQDDAMALDVLTELHDKQQLDLVLYESAKGNRFSPQSLADHHGGGESLTNTHVAVCGPASVVSLVQREARALGASDVEHEDFDIRQGFGPDLSRDVEDLVTRVRA